MFYGRQDELNLLQGLWNKSSSSFVLCSGRRRVGKSTLIEEFAASKIDCERLAVQTGTKEADADCWAKAFDALAVTMKGRGKQVVFHGRDMKDQVKCPSARSLVFALLALVAAAAADGRELTPAMSVAKPGDVKPAGWLLDRARAARDGFTGHMDDVDEHFRLAWTTNCMRRGRQLNWHDAHRGSWSAEGGAYWFDGLVKLAHQLDDAELKALAGRRLEAVLENVGTNTIGFLWWYDRNRPADVEEAFSHGLWRIWTAGISERALSAWRAATGDPRVDRVLRNAFSYEELGRRCGGSTPSLLSAVFDAWRVTQDPVVARCLDLCSADIEKNPYFQPPWEGEEETLGLRRRSLLKLLKVSADAGVRHGVGACEYLYSLLCAYQWTGDEKLRDSVVAWYAFFDRFCRQPYGVTVMDEEWGWAGAKRGTETCDVAAESFTRENLLAVLGDGKWGDDVERAFFNAGPACVSRDFRRHVYFQMPNRTGEKGENRQMSLVQPDGHVRYGVSVWPLCCTAALNRILPNYVQHMWLKTADGGVAAALYGPSTFATEIPVGRVAFEERTRYPFEETVEILVKEAPDAAFTLKLRLPAWCPGASVEVNGAPWQGVAAKGFAALRRTWRTGDRVTLAFPMRPRLEDFRDMNDFGKLRRSVVMGPLLFAQAIPTADDNTPDGPVREAALASDLDPASVLVERREFPSRWDWPENSPLRLRLSDASGVPLTLVPYGCTKLRISAFACQDRERPAADDVKNEATETGIREASGAPVPTNLRGHEDIEWSVGYDFGYVSRPDLPRVLLVGDSVCRAYGDGVRERLEGVANVSSWASSYCVTSPGYLKLLAFYLDEAPYDVIHFNNGLHSLETPVADWERGLEAALRLIRQKQPNAKVVWAASTPLKDPAKTAKSKALNAAAQRVLARLGGDIGTNDLFTPMDALDREKEWADVFHFREPARARQAELVAGACAARLPAAPSRNGQK